MASSNLFDMFTKSIKGVTKSYIMHYPCVVIILFNKGFCRYAFSTIWKTSFFFVFAFCVFLF